MKKRILAIFMCISLIVCAMPCFVVEAAADTIPEPSDFSDHEPVHRVFTTDLKDIFLDGSGKLKFEYTTGSDGTIVNNSPTAGAYVSSYFPRDNGEVTVVDGFIGFRNSKTNTTANSLETHGWFRGFSLKEPDANQKFTVKSGYSYKITYNYDVILKSNVKTNIFISSGWGYSSGAANILSDDSHETFTAITSSKELTASAYDLTTEQEFVASFNNIDESGFRVTLGDYNKSVNCNALIVIKSITVEENELLTFSTNLVDFMPSAAAVPDTATKYTSVNIASSNLYRQKFVYDTESGAYGLGVTYGDTGVGTFPTESNYSGKRPFAIIVPQNINITDRDDILTTTNRCLLADPKLVYKINVEYEIRKASASKSYFAIVANKSNYGSGVGYSYTPGSYTGSKTSYSGTLNANIFGELHTTTSTGTTDVDKFIGIGFASTKSSDMFIVKKVTVQVAKHFVDLSSGICDEVGSGFSKVTDPDNSLISYGLLNADEVGNFTVNNDGNPFQCIPGHTYTIDMDINLKYDGNPFSVYLGSGALDTKMVPIDSVGQSLFEGEVTSNEWSHLTYTISLSKKAPANKCIYFRYNIPNIYIKNVTISDPEGVFYGDVNSDKTLDVNDALHLRSNLANVTGYETVDKTTADVDLSKEIDLVDTAVLERNLAEWQGFEALPYMTENVKTVTLNVNGKIMNYKGVNGSSLPVQDDFYDETNDSIVPFIGWYDSTFTTKYTTVSPDVDEYYAKFDHATVYTFESKTYYDPNSKYTGTAPSTGLNVWRFAADPLDENNTTAFADLTSNAGATHFAFPSYDGINEGFTLSKGKTYSVSFKYRVVGSYAPVTTFTLKLCSKSKVGGVGGKSGDLASATSTNDGAWHTVTFSDFTAPSDMSSYPYLILVVQHSSSAQSIKVYIDDFIINVYDDESPLVNFVINGKEKSGRAYIDRELPVIDDIYVSAVDKSIHFLGWYNYDYTVKYTKFLSGVTKYYAKFDQTVLTYDTGALYDPNKKFTATYRYTVATEDGNPSNRCLKASYNGTPSGNDNISLSISDHLPVPYTLTPGKKYIVIFDSKVVSKTGDPVVSKISYQLRGSTDAGIGKSGGKTDPVASSSSINDGEWHTDCSAFVAPEEVSESKNLLFFAMYTGTVSCDLYLDNFMIFEFDEDEVVVVKKPANNVKFNDNGHINQLAVSYIGDPLPAPTAYDKSIKFLGWRSAENLNVIIPNIPRSEMQLVAKYDADINDFDGYGIYDPFGAVAEDGKYSLVAKSGAVDGKALKVDLTGTGGNHNTALTASGYYPTSPYMLKTGNTYTITTRYFVENMTDGTSVLIQYRGSNASGIGKSGGKTSVLGGIVVKDTSVGQWLTSTVSFTYTEDSNAYPYLLLLTQDETGRTATVYYDYIAIKETAPERTFADRSTDKINGYSFNYTLSGRKQYIVVPTYNFPYLAKMQVENLETVLVNCCGAQFEYLHEDEDKYDHSQNAYMSRIVIGDVTSNVIKSSELGVDQYAIRFPAGGKVYINGGSTYALAMGVSEFARMIEANDDGKNFTSADNVLGSYKEAVKNYSNNSYYMPTLLEDFNGSSVNTKYWNVYEPSGTYTSTSTGWYDNNYNYARSYRLGDNTVVSDGSLKIYATYESGLRKDGSGKNIISYYGGMLRSHGKVKYRQGYAEISCRIPLGNGFWTTLWFTNPGEAMGYYTAEVDVNENYGISNAESCASNFHLWPTSAGSNNNLVHLAAETSSDIGTRYMKADAGTSLFDEFHTYGFMWCEDYCQITFDGDVVYTYFLDTEYKRDAMSDYLSIIVSMAVGFANDGNSRPLIPHYDDSGKWITGETFKAGTVIDGVKLTKDTYMNYSDIKQWNETNFYEVDYVHIYQLAGQELIIAN